MNNITLKPMIKALARQFYKGFELDPELYLDKSEYKPFQYSDAFSDRRVERYAALGRIFLAVMLDEVPVGEIVLKDIDLEKQSCIMGISLINDNYKNKGIGTAAEKLILEYAFRQLNMQTVFADVVITNLRSRHVLEKVGFVETYRDDVFVYYRCDRRNWDKNDPAGIPRRNY